MVPIATPRSAFEAKVLVARLGSEGILWELRGAVDGMYPLGNIEILVAEDEVARARELLLVDEIESAFAGDDEPPHPLATGRDWLVVVAVLAVLALFLVMRVLAATA